MTDAPRLVVCLKWVDRRPEIDSLSGAVTTDDRFSGASPADLAALEWALRLAETTGGEVTAVSVGPSEAQAMLRDALAIGATRAVLIDDGRDRSGPSERVANLLAGVCADAEVVCCGIHSLDRGSGSVPAFLANALGIPQALGLVAATSGTASMDDHPYPSIETERRLDHGRRERLQMHGRCVLSFEGGVSPRRAPLTATLAAASAMIEVVAPTASGQEDSVRAAFGDATPHVVATGPYRPRAKVKPAPVGSTQERIISLLSTDSGDAGAAVVHELSPEDAAQLVIERLVAWGYIEDAEAAIDGEPAGRPATTDS